MAANQREISALIRARREQLHLSQQDVSDGLDISRGSYSRLESGQTSVSAADLTKIAAILKTRASYLLGEDTEDHANSRGDDVVRLYGGIRKEMQSAALAMMQGLYDRFKRDDKIDKTAEKTRH